MPESSCNCDGCKAHERHSQEFPRDNWNRDTKRLAEWVLSNMWVMQFYQHSRLETVKYDMNTKAVHSMKLKNADVDAVATYILDYIHFNLWPVYYTACNTRPVPDCHLTKQGKEGKEEKYKKQPANAD